MSGLAGDEDHLMVSASAYPYREPRVDAERYQCEVPPLCEAPPSVYTSHGEEKIWDPNSLAAPAVEEFLGATRDVLRPACSSTAIDNAFRTLNEPRALELLHQSKYNTDRASYSVIHRLISPDEGLPTVPDAAYVARLPHSVTNATLQPSRRRRDAESRAPAAAEEKKESPVEEKSQEEENGLQQQQHQQQPQDVNGSPGSIKQEGMVAKARNAEDGCAVVRPRLSGLGEDVDTFNHAAVAAIQAFHARTPPQPLVMPGTLAGADQQHMADTVRNFRSRRARFKQKRVERFRQLIADVLGQRHRGADQDIDVERLRTLVNDRRDAAPKDDAIPRKRTSQTPEQRAKAQADRARAKWELEFLEGVLEKSDAWLAVAQRALNTKQGVSLQELQRLLRVADAALPMVNSRQKKRIEGLVEKAQAWVAKAEEAVKEALSDEGQKMTVSQVLSLVKECDKSFPGVFTDEAAYLRSCHAFAKSFASLSSLDPYPSSKSSSKSRSKEEQEDTKSKDEPDVKRASRSRDRGSSTEAAKPASKPKPQRSRPRRRLQLPLARKLLQNLNERAPFMQVKQKVILENEIAKAEQWIADARAIMATSSELDEQGDEEEDEDDEQEEDEEEEEQNEEDGEKEGTANDAKDEADDGSAMVDDDADEGDAQATSGNDEEGSNSSAKRTKKRKKPLSKNAQVTARIQELMANVSEIRLQLPEAAALRNDLQRRQWSGKVRALHASARKLGLLGPRPSALRDMVDEARHLRLDVARTPVLRRQLETLDIMDAAVADALSALNPKARKRPLEEWHALLERLQAIPVELTETSRVQKVVTNTQAWKEQAAKLLMQGSQKMRTQTIPGARAGLHAISFEEVQSVVARAKGSKMALMPRNEWPQNELRQLHHAGERWCNHVNQHLKSLNGRASARSSAAAVEKKRKAREVSVQKLATLLAKFREYDPKPKEQGEEKKEAGGEKDGDEGDEGDSSSSSDAGDGIARGLGSDLPPLCRLRLRLVTKADKRLKEVAENLRWAWETLKGPFPTSLDDLLELVSDLRSGGAAEASEPLLSLSQRVEGGTSWRERATQMLNAGLEEEKEGSGKGKGGKARSSSRRRGKHSKKGDDTGAAKEAADKKSQAGTATAKNPLSATRASQEREQKAALPMFSELVALMKELDPAFDVNNPLSLTPEELEKEREEEAAAAAAADAAALEIPEPSDVDAKMSDDGKDQQQDNADEGDKKGNDDDDDDDDDDDEEEEQEEESESESEEEGYAYKGLFRRAASAKARLEKGDQALLDLVHVPEEEDIRLRIKACLRWRREAQKVLELLEKEEQKQEADIKTGKDADKAATGVDDAQMTQEKTDEAVVDAPDSNEAAAVASDAPAKANPEPSINTRRLSALLKRAQALRIDMPEVVQVETRFWIRAWGESVRKATSRPTSVHVLADLLSQMRLRVKRYIRLNPELRQRWEEMQVQEESSSSSEEEAATESSLEAKDKEDADSNQAQQGADKAKDSDETAMDVDEGEKTAAATPAAAAAAPAPPAAAAPAAASAIASAVKSEPQETEDTTMADGEAAASDVPKAAVDAPNASTTDAKKAEEPQKPAEADGAAMDVVKEGAAKEGASDATAVKKEPASSSPETKKEDQRAETVKACVASSTLRAERLRQPSSSLDTATEGAGVGDDAVLGDEGDELNLQVEFYAQYRDEVRLLEQRIAKMRKWNVGARALFDRRLGQRHANIVLGALRPVELTSRYDERPAAQTASHGRRSATAAALVAAAAAAERDGTNATASDDAGGQIEQRRAGRVRSSKRSSKSASDGDTAASEASSSRSRKRSSKSSTSGSSAAAAAGGSDKPVVLYCYCKRPHVDGELMIGCDGDDCNFWCHASCISITKNDVKQVKDFLCPKCCVKKNKPFRFRSKLPTRKPKVRGPKLADLLEHLTKKPKLVTSPESDALERHVKDAKDWIARSKVALVRDIMTPEIQKRLEEAQAAKEAAAKAKIEADAKAKKDAAEAAIKEAKEKKAEAAAAAAAALAAATPAKPEAGSGKEDKPGEPASADGSKTAAPTPAPANATAAGKADGKADSKPADGKPADGKPADGKPADGKPADGKPADGKPAAVRTAGDDGDAAMADGEAKETNKASEAAKTTPAPAATSAAAPASAEKAVSAKPAASTTAGSAAATAATGAAEEAVKSDDKPSTSASTATDKPASASAPKSVDAASSSATKATPAPSRAGVAPAAKPVVAKKEAPKSKAKPELVPGRGGMTLAEQAVAAEREKQRREKEAAVKAEKDRLSAERKLRNDLKKEREAQSDKLYEMLREAMGIPVEFPERIDVEERLRLLLSLERAERILIHNTLSRVTASSKRAARKGKSFKELCAIHTELVRTRAEQYKDRNPEQNKVWFRFERFVKQVTRWVQAVREKLEGSSTLKELVKLQKEWRQDFPLVTTQQETSELEKRIKAVNAWIPKEKKALQAKKKVSALTKLLFEDRFADCKKTTSPHTVKIEKEINRAENWRVRFHKAIDGKADVATFKQLLKEAQGPARVLAEAKDVKLAEEMTNRYCLCQVLWEDGVFMVGCDSCSDWFHPKCVNMTEKQAQEEDKYECPFCARRASKTYKYGVIDGFHNKPPAEASQGKDGASGASGSANKAKRKRDGASDAAEKRSAALYATLLYENLHDKVSAENSNVLWHLLNAYMNRPLDARLQEEIIEAVKLVCGESVLKEALAAVNKLYYTQLRPSKKQNTGGASASSSPSSSSSSSSSASSSSPKAKQTPPATAAAAVAAAAAAGKAQPAAAAAAAAKTAVTTSASASLSASSPASAAVAAKPATSAPASAPAPAPASASAPAQAKAATASTATPAVAAVAATPSAAAANAASAPTATAATAAAAAATPTTATAAAKPKSSRARKRRPRDYPKNPLTAYKFFMRELKQDKTELHAAMRDPGNEAKSQNKIISEKWRRLGKEQKTRFEEMSEQARKQYEEDVAAWHAKNPNYKAEEGEEDEAARSATPPVEGEAEQVSATAKAKSVPAVAAPAAAVPAATPAAVVTKAAVVAATPATAAATKLAPPLIPSSLPAGSTVEQRQRMLIAHQQKVHQEMEAQRKLLEQQRKQLELQRKQLELAQRQQLLRQQALEQQHKQLAQQSSPVSAVVPGAKPASFVPTVGPAIPAANKSQQQQSQQPKQAAAPAPASAAAAAAAATAVLPSPAAVRTPPQLQPPSPQAAGGALGVTVAAVPVAAGVVPVVPGAVSVSAIAQKQPKQSVPAAKASADAQQPPRKRQRKPTKRQQQQQQQQQKAEKELPPVPKLTLVKTWVAAENRFRLSVKGKGQKRARASPQQQSQQQQGPQRSVPTIAAVPLAASQPAPAPAAAGVVASASQPQPQPKPQPKPQPVLASGPVMPPTQKRQRIAPAQIAVPLAFATASTPAPQAQPQAQSQPPVFPALRGIPALPQLAGVPMQRPPQGTIPLMPMVMPVPLPQPGVPPVMGVPAMMSVPRLPGMPPVPVPVPGMQPQQPIRPPQQPPAGQQQPWPPRS